MAVYSHLTEVVTLDWQEIMSWSVVLSVFIMSPSSPTKRLHVESVVLNSCTSVMTSGVGFPVMPFVF
jgi:hypothetical protein